MHESSEEALLACILGMHVNDLPQFFVTTASSKLGGDIDIFCLNAKEFEKFITPRIQSLTLGATRIRIKKRGKGHLHVDILETKSERLILRLDVHGVSYFCRLGLDSNFGKMTHARSEVREASANLLTGNRIARKSDLAIIRLGGYVQSYWTGRDKLHHIDWILSSFSQEEIAELVEEGSKTPIRRPRITRAHPAMEFLASLAIFFSSPRVFAFIRRAKNRRMGE